jgi:type I restriction enzyme S subunit
MPPSQFDIPWENLRNLPITLPNEGDQRRIADFLNAETARIDRLSQLRKDMSAKLTERENAVRDRRIELLAKDKGYIYLRRLITTIEQGSSPQCHSSPRQEASEWGVLKLSSVKRGMFFPNENKKLPEEGYIHTFKEVRPGDLLITRANTPTLVGDSAVVTETCARLLLPDLIYRANLVSGTDPTFVSHVLLGKQVRSLIEAIARGSSQSMVKLRGEDIRSLPIPDVPFPQQRAFAREMTENGAQIGELQQRLVRQIELLEERRRALITAAVTGQFDVSAASGRGVME